MPRERPRVPAARRRLHQGQIEGYIALKWPEVYMMEHTPHPVEYQMYYSL